LLQLAEGFVAVRRTLASTAFAAAPGVLVVRVATRLVPSHSDLHLIKLKTRPRRAGPCYRSPRPAAKTAGRALLQSVLREKVLRLQAFTTDQPIELGTRQADGQQRVPRLVVSLALHGIQCEELRPQPAQALRQAQRA